MIDKLKIRVDLRTPSAMEEEFAPKIYATEAERQQAFEEKCSKFIDQFQKLNLENGIVLDDARDQLRQFFDHQIEVIDKKVKDNFLDI